MWGSLVDMYRQSSQAWHAAEKEVDAVHHGSDLAAPQTVRLPAALCSTWRPAHRPVGDRWRFCCSSASPGSASDSKTDVNYNLLCEVH